jgi:hypothetical protein
MLHNPEYALDELRHDITVRRSREQQCSRWTSVRWKTSPTTASKSQTSVSLGCRLRERGRRPPNTTNAGRRRSRSSADVEDVLRAVEWSPNTKVELKSLDVWGVARCYRTSQQETLCVAQFKSAAASFKSNKCASTNFSWTQNKHVLWWRASFL